MSDGRGSRERGHFLGDALTMVGLGGCVLLVVLAWLAKDEGMPSRTEYDDLDDATRVRVGPVGGLVSMELDFACTGDGLCVPDSAGITVSSAPGQICPEDERRWNTADSLSFGCRRNQGELVVGLEGPDRRIPLSGVLIMGRKLSGDDLIVEDAIFDLGYDDLRFVAEQEAPLGLTMGDGLLPLPPEMWQHLDRLASTLDEEADPNSTQWDASVSADYDEAADSTSLYARLAGRSGRSDSGLGPMELTGQCPGRGWCPEPEMELVVTVDDPASFAGNLTDVEFVINDSLSWKPQVVEVHRSGPFGSVRIRVLPDVLSLLAGASLTEYYLGGVGDSLTTSQLSTVERFWRRTTESESREY